MTDFVLLTCEHGGNRVPAEFVRLFQRQRDVLESHRAYDPGALPLAKTLSQRLEVPLHVSTVTRLLVELNRSLNHPVLFSEFTKALSPEVRAAILAKYYVPYRSQVGAAIDSAIKRGQRVLHLSVHTFTPILNNRERRADIGILYDPGRRGEQRFANQLKQSFANGRPDLRVRKNYPYLGKSDGFTTALRKKHGESHYAGIEIEINQRWYFGGQAEWRRLTRDFVEIVADCVGQ